jgi:hypothetical protein
MPDIYDLIVLPGTPVQGQVDGTADDFDIVVTDPAPVVTGTGAVVLTELSLTGPPGIAGPRATPEFYPVVGVSTWTHTHSFAYPPDVRVLDAAEESVLIAASYPAPDQVSLTFPAPFTGTILLT